MAKKRHGQTGLRSSPGTPYLSCVAKNQKPQVIYLVGWYVGQIYWDGSSHGLKPSWESRTYLRCRIAPFSSVPTPCAQNFAGHSCLTEKETTPRGQQLGASPHRWAWGPFGSPEAYNIIFFRVHPGRLTWKLRIHPWKKKIIFQTIIFRFYVNLAGCTLSRK